MGAATSTSNAPAAAEAPTLLDTLARAPAAAALVVGALEEVDDREALRLACTQMRDAVGEAETKLGIIRHSAAPADAAPLAAPRGADDPWAQLGGRRGART